MVTPPPPPPLAAFQDGMRGKEGVEFQQVLVETHSSLLQVHYLY